MNIGSRLKQILEERNINVSQFARDAQIPAQTIYAMIKRDSNKADMDIMARILEALDMDLLEFLQMEPRKKSGAKKAAPTNTTIVAKPEVVAEPEVTEEPEVMEEPEAIEEPEIVEEPEVIEEPEEPVRSYRRELESYLL